MKKTFAWDIHTRMVHTGTARDLSGLQTLNPPIFQSTNFLYEDVESGTEILLGKKEGYIYSRYSNPTVDALNEAVSDLENGDAALSFSSGLAAIAAVVMAYCRTGDHLVASSLIYGGTYHLFKEQLSRQGIEVTFVDPTDLDGLVESIRPNTRLLYTEPLANPTLVSSDIFKWAVIAHQHHCKLVVDNTFTPPPIFRPLDAGADVVIHSATKYLGGHSDLTGGVVAASREEIEIIRPIMKYYGGIISPFVAWLLLRGLRTLPLRLERQSSNALKIAHFLETHPNVGKVNYAGLPSNPQFDFNRRQFNGYSGMLSFEVKGGFAAAKQVMQHLEIIRFTGSLGDVSSLISHPASTSHVYLTPQERAALGIADGLLRLSVGIEKADDLIHDLQAALEQIPTGT